MSTQGLALAGEASGSGGGSSGGLVWVLPYAFVVLCIGLGLFIVCRGARRKERARPEQYEKISLIDRGDAEKAVAQEKRHGIRRTKQECPEAKKALVLSIVGFFLCFPVCIFSLIQGIKARKLIAGDRRLSGDGKALAAIVISASALLPLVLWVFVVIGLLMGSVLSGDAPSEPAEPAAVEAEAEPEA